MAIVLNTKTSQTVGNLEKYPHGVYSIFQNVL